jgi:hypothetical protein
MRKAALLYERVELEIPDVELPCVEFAEKRGWLCQKLVSQTSRGWPDRFFARSGVIVFWEFKRKGSEPTLQQLARHREMREHGIIVKWTDNVEEFMAYMR